MTSITSRVARGVRIAGKDIRYALRSRASVHPMYLRFAQHGEHRDEVLGDGTAIVIDGFPRSANTFAAIAFQMAQGTPVRIAHNLHSAAHLAAAASRGLPTIVLIRDPTDAVLSEAIREQPVSLKTVLAAYCRFYETVDPWLPNMTVGEFSQVTHDLGAVIREMNRRCGSAFRPFDADARSTSDVFGLIDERERRPAVKAVDEYLAGKTSLDAVWATYRDLDGRGEPSTVPERSVPRPSAVRAELKAELRHELEDPALMPLRERADRAYRCVVQGRHTLDGSR